MLTLQPPRMPTLPPAIDGKGAPAPVRQTPRAEEIRARLRKTGADLYAIRGVDGVSIAEIADAAAVSPGSASRTYRKRRDLLFDIAYAHIDALHEYTGQADDAHAGAAPQERLEAVALALLNGMFHQRNAHQAMRLAEPELSAGQRDALRFQMRILLHRIAAIIVEALPALSTHREYEAPLARMLMTMAAAAPAWFRDDGGLTRQDYARLMVRSIVNGGDAMLVTQAAVTPCW